MVVKLWWVDGDLWCFDGRLLGPKNTPRFLDLFLGWRGKAKATTKAKAIMLSLRPSGFAPAFGRAVAAARWLRRWASAVQTHDILYRLSRDILYTLAFW